MGCWPLEEAVQTAFDPNSVLLLASIPLTWKEGTSLILVLLGHMACFGHGRWEEVAICQV